jgi:phenylacetate-coenzyme A ligase PaaK-like adenylate-forming protein
MNTSFCECKYGCGGHHHPELIICELIDDEGNVVPEGEAGELVITTLEWKECLCCVSAPETWLVFITNRVPAAENLQE